MAFEASLFLFKKGEIKGLNNLKLYHTPPNNIFEERKKQIANIERISKQILQSTGYELIKNGKYESLDPSSRTFYQVIKAESIEPIDGKKRKAEIKLPIDDNGAYLIHGNRYVPVFQISDVPIFKRTGDFIMLHNSFCTLVLDSSITNLRIGNAAWPLCLVLLRTAKSKLFTKRNFIDHDTIDDGFNGVRLRLTKDIDVRFSRKMFGDSLDVFNDEEHVEKFNDSQSQFETIEEGIENVLRSWELKAKIDKVVSVMGIVDFIMVPNGVFSEPFTMTDLLIHVVKNREKYKTWEIREINDVSKRRVRLSEWVCYKLSQQYKTNDAKKSKAVYADSLLSLLNVDSRRVLDDTVNPLGELCIQSRVIFDGAGGIAKDACSVLVRNLHESYKGVIDPIDTPTGEAVGICQHAIPDITLENGVMKASDSGNILSVASELVPLLQHDDGTRIEMACNQQRQSICLAEPEIPLVKSGCEHLYTEYTSSLRVAKDSGQVIYKDDRLMVIKYDNGDGEVIDISPRSFTDFDKTLRTTLNVGDRFKKGITLANTNNINPITHELMLGKNMLVGFMSLDSWNFEDAVVISESAANKLRYLDTYQDTVEIGNRALFSLKENDYVPILPNGTYVNKGDILFKMAELDPCSIDSMTPIFKEIYAPISGIFKYEYFIKEISSTNIQFQKYNRHARAEHQKREDRLKEVFSYIPDDQKNNIRYCYLPNAKKINDKSGIIKWSIEGEADVELGCKLSNRHGHKGVVSIIIPDDQMPQLPDGRALDIVFNPLGVITRMNVGQLFELHLTWLMDQWLHKSKTLSDSEFEKEVIKFISIIDNTTNKIYTTEATKYVSEHPEVLYEIRSEGLQIIQPSFESCTIAQLEELKRFVGVDYETGVMYNGNTYQCSVGWMYVMRLHHEPSHKIFGRSIGTYGAHGQPPSGANSHRLGEMEAWALQAYEATDTLKEFMSIKSDNPHERLRLFRYMYDNQTEMYQPETLDTITCESFKTYMKGAGLKIEFGK